MSASQTSQQFPVVIGMQLCRPAMFYEMWFRDTLGSLPTTKGAPQRRAQSLARYHIYSAKSFAQYESQQNFLTAFPVPVDKIRPCCEPYPCTKLHFH